MRIKIGINMKRIFSLLASLMFVFSVISCQVGLGEIVDMQAPSVTVNSPERTGYVQQIFTITGSASDNTGVTKLILQIAPLDNPTEENTVQFKVENQEWYKLNGDVWNKYLDDHSSITGSKTDYKWKLTYELPASTETGTDFVLTTQVYDAYNNEGKNSKDERSFTVDMEEPVVSMIAPSLKSYSVEKELSATYKLNDNSVLTNLYNGEFTISGSQKEDMKLSHMFVYLLECDDINGGYASLYGKTDLKTLNEEVFNKAVLSVEVEGDNLRNWSTTVNPSLIEKYKTGKHIFCIITESHDTAHNIETKAQGCFTYWNEADIPWVNAAFGGDSYAKEEVAAVYPSCALQGQAYDDDGLKSITIRIYKGDSTTALKTEVIQLDEENNPKYKAWTINALGENCSFRVEVECEDIYGKKSKLPHVNRYMVVTDTNPPKIVIESDTKTVMMGDSNGNIVLNGYVTDDGEISSLKLVRVKTGTNSDKLIEYYNSEYSEWNKASSSGYVDANGNKIWNLELQPETTYRDENNVLVHKRTFRKEFNIFSVFGINGTSEKLSTQNFIIMATDNGKCSNIDSFTWAGDTEAPKLTIDSVIVKNGTTEKQKITFPAEKKSLQPLAATDIIYISGTWSDNSTDNWSGTLKAKHGQIKLSLNGKNIAVTPDDTNGTWTSSAITLTDATTAAISAEISDYAGNLTRENDCFFISSSNPELLRISAEQSDGSYKAETQILITMEFNKAVTFDETKTKPTLLLNVPYTTKNRLATYKEGNGSTTHKYLYTVQSGDDISVLNVEGINTNGNTWVDKDGNSINNLTKPADSNNLGKSRTISIDTIIPVISKVKTITPAGSYNAGKEIFIQAEFSEEVKITDVSKLIMTMNTGKKTDVSSTIQTGPKTVLFTYKVAAGENTSQLQVESIIITGAGIVDNAGNTLNVPNISTIDFTGMSTIKIDTAAPGLPSVTGITEGACIYELTGTSFQISYDTDPSVNIKQYSLDSGKTWMDYTSTVSIVDDGEYFLTARQQDDAGNVSDNSTLIHFNIDKGHILTSVTAGVPTGTYTTEQIIPIYLNFRKEVKVANASNLSLNLSNNKTAVYDATHSTATKALFNYKIEEGDSIEALNVSSINGTFTDSDNRNIDKYIKTIPKGKNLADSRSIKIITGKPVISSCVLDGNTLTVTYNYAVTKASGNITITQSDTYKAPAVLSVDEYKKLVSKNDNLKNYYEPGTNGSDANGVSDLTEKYILKYIYNTDGTWDGFKTGTDTNWLTELTTKAKANQVVIPINSSYVTINDKVMTISLTDSYALPIKGASYTVNFSAGLVKDKLNHSCTIENKIITSKGLADPVIRINKEDEKIDLTSKTVTQPTTAGVKIDCQTPGIQRNAGLSWKVEQQINSQDSYVKSNDKYTVISQKEKSLTENTALGSARTNVPFTLGDSTNTTNGYIYKITATAAKTGETNVISYEYAYRSVYTLVKAPISDVGSDQSYKQFWLRGGDWNNGGLSTPGFPFSWNTVDYSKVRAMTYYQTSERVNNNTETYDNAYYITWKINTKAYTTPLRGDLPEDAAVNGPSVWCWGMQGPIPRGLEYYVLYPGQSLQIDGSCDYLYGAMSFSDKHCEYRNGNVVVKRKKN